VALTSGVSATVSGSTVSVKGPKGELKLSILPEVSVKVNGESIVVSRRGEGDEASARQGLTRQLLESMVMGVSRGFEKKLEVIGVGYKAQVQGRKLILSLGLSHPVEYRIPEGITITQDEKNKNLLTVQGISKQLVGQVAADIRAYRRPEPYKGKGIRYVDEVVRRKPGKAAAGKGAIAAPAAS
jgi:large subunit ribosomal protein L6